MNGMSHGRGISSMQSVSRILEAGFDAVLEEGDIEASASYYDKADQIIESVRKGMGDDFVDVYWDSVYNPNEGYRYPQ